MNKSGYKIPFRIEMARNVTVINRKKFLGLVIKIHRSSIYPQDVIWMLHFGLPTSRFLRYCFHYPTNKNLKKSNLYLANK